MHCVYNICCVECTITRYVCSGGEAESGRTSAGEHVKKNMWRRTCGAAITWLTVYILYINNQADRGCWYKASCWFIWYFMLNQLHIKPVCTLTVSHAPHCTVNKVKAQSGDTLWRHLVSTTYKNKDIIYIRRFSGKHPEGKVSRDLMNRHFTSCSTKLLYSFCWNPHTS